MKTCVIVSIEISCPSCLLLRSTLDSERGCDLCLELLTVMAIPSPVFLSKFTLTKINALALQINVWLSWRTIYVCIQT